MLSIKTEVFIHINQYDLSQCYHYFFVFQHFYCFARLIRFRITLESHSTVKSCIVRISGIASVNTEK